MFKFDEELERDRRNSEAVPIYHVGRGGVGNLINEKDTSRRDSSTSERSNTSRNGSRKSWEWMTRR